MSSFASISSASSDVEGVGRRGVWAVAGFAAVTAVTSDRAVCRSWSAGCDVECLRPQPLVAGAGPARARTPCGSVG